MGKILSNRDYHLAKFKIGKYIEKGADILSPSETQDLNDLIVEMRTYEREHLPGVSNTTLTGLLNEYLERRHDH